MSLHTDLTLRLRATLGYALDLAPQRVPLDLGTRFEWESGTGADQADRMFTDRRTLDPSADEEIDLTALPDGLGHTFGFARLKIVVVVASEANVNAVEVSRAEPGSLAGKPFSDGVSVWPGGLFVWAVPTATGMVVGPPDRNAMQFANSGGGTPVTYDVVIIGTSA